MDTHFVVCIIMNHDNQPFVKLMKLALFCGN